MTIERKELINEIYDICFKLEIFINSANERRTKENIGILLEEVELVESLYNAIFVKAKKRKILYKKRITSLLVELEKIRLELEIKE